MCLAFFKFWKKNPKEPDQPPIPLRPSPATAVPDQLSPASNISQPLPHAEISNPLPGPDAPSSVLVTPDVSAGSPPPTSTAQLLTPSVRVGTSTAVVKRAEVPSHAIESPESSAVSRQDELWNRAYEELKSKEPKIVDAYEKLLSVKLRDIDALPNEETKNRISTLPEDRWKQMRKVADAGLKKTERSTAIQERVNDVIQAVSPFKQVIDQVVQVVPQAAIPWVGVSLAFEILSNPFTEPGIHREGVIYVISRMDWYINLTDPLLDHGSPELQVSLHRQHLQLEEHTVELYQKLLLYQMKSIYCFHKNDLDRFLRNIVKVDDWSGQLDDIKKTEAAVEKDLQGLQNQAMLDHLNKQTLKGDRQLEMLQRLLILIHDHNQRERVDKNQREEEQINKECRRHLFQTDPSLDRRRILDTKGGLLKASYDWIIDNPGFKQWRTDERSRRLWIKGDPGKGKTMLLCGIIEELEEEHRLCYFFCQATEEKLNTANGVLRGLIYNLVQRYPELLSHVRKEYDRGAQGLFEDHNAWQVLCRILESILEDDDLEEVLIIVDALDECKDIDDREKLLKFICKISAGSRAKLILSSRNWPDIQKILGKEEQHAMTLSLELNEDSISDAVQKYIERKVEDLAQDEPYKSNRDLCYLVQDRLVENSSNTFLWVALVCQELGGNKATNPRKVRQILRELPSDLQGLYSRMIENVSVSADSKLCMEILAVVSVVKRPVTFLELFYIIDSSLYYDLQLEDMKSTIGSCGSFLNIQRDTIYFVHQSAVDFLHSDASTLPGISMRHRSIFWNSLNTLLTSEHLKRDIYGLEAPATPYESIKLPHPDPLSDLHYCCMYWVDHFTDWIHGGNTISTATSPTEGDAMCKVQSFLESKLLYWIEGLALHGQMQQAVRAIQSLQALVDGILNAVGQDLANLVHDATRFLLYHSAMIATTPFQLYASALCFSPEESVVKRIFRHEEPKWVTVSLGPGTNWSACLQTLVDHTRQVRTLAYSTDGQWFLSGSDDGTAKLWDTETGTCVHTLNDHGLEPLDWNPGNHRRATVRMAAFSADSQQVVTGSRNGIVKLWNRANGTCIRETQYQTGKAKCMTVSSDLRRIAFALPDSAVTVYDGNESHPVHRLEGHANVVRSMSFSPHGNLLATASGDLTVMIWDLTTGDCERTLEGHDDCLHWVIFSSNGKQLASSDTIVRLWDTETGKPMSKFPLKWMYKAKAVRSIAFSTDDRLLAAASDSYVHVWDIVKESIIWRVKGDEYKINSLSISPDASRLVSASFDRTIKVWDLSIPYSEILAEESDAQTYLVSFSTDGHQVAAYYSEIQNIKVWNKTLPGPRAELRIDDNYISAVAFSIDNNTLACASSKGKISVWDLETGARLEAFGEEKPPPSHECCYHESDLEADSEEENFEDSDSDNRDPDERYFGAEVTSLAFRSDLQLASSAFGIIKIWNIFNGTCEETLDGHDDRIMGMTFSPDGQWLAYCSWYFEIAEGYPDWEVKIWNLTTWTCVVVPEIFMHKNPSMTFSVDNKLAWAEDGKIRVWDVKSETFLHSIEIQATDRTDIHVSFDTKTPTRLHTEFGFIELDQCTKNTTLGKETSRSSKDDMEDEDETPFLPGYSLSRKRDWVWRDGKKALWIPPEYRLDSDSELESVTPVINGSILMWINEAARIVRLHFNTRKQSGCEVE